MHYLISIVGLIIVFLLALLVSSDRKKIKMKPIIIMIVIQIALAALLLNTKFGLIVVKGSCECFW